MADWRATLFDRLTPTSGLELDEADKSRLGRQSLLHAALAMAQPNGGNTFAAIANGLQTGLLAANQGADDLAARRYKQQMFQSQLAGPAGIREFEALADAANLKKGTPEYQRAAQIRLGMEGRASNAGFGFRTEDINGVPTLVITDPRTGRTRPATLEDVPAPLSGALPDKQAAAGSGSLLDFGALTQDFQAQFPGVAITSGFRTPEKNAAVDGVPNSFHLTGEAFDVATRTPQETQAAIAWAQQNGLQAINEGDHVHFEPPRRGIATSPLPAGKPITGRRKEEEAAAVEAAKYGAQINAQPTLNSLEAQRAAMVKQAEENARINAFLSSAGMVGDAEALAASKKAGAEAAAKAGVAREDAAKDKDTALKTYETAMAGLVSGLSGTTTGPVAGRMPAVTTNAQIAQGAQAAMAPILKQLFRSAGEGSFTDSDQKLLLDMIPTRMDTPAAAKAKVANIDAIVRAKLGMNNAADAAPSSAVGGSGWAIRKVK